MTTKDREAVIAHVLLACHDTRKSKGEDYAGKVDVLANFKRNAERLGLTPFQIIQVYMNKHFDAINSAIAANPEGPKDSSEPISGRIVDAINYLLLLQCMICEKEKERVVQAEAPTHTHDDLR